MSIRNIISLYSGKVFTVLEHIQHNTSIAQFLYTSAQNKYITINKAQALIPIQNQDPEKEQAIIGIAEMLTKILIFKKLRKDEHDMYYAENLKKYAAHFSSFLNKLDTKEIDDLKEGMKEGKFIGLQNRLNCGYLESFIEHEEGPIARATLLFQLNRFYTRKELQWLKYEITPDQTEVIDAVWQMAHRASDTLISELNPKEIDAFPEFGSEDELYVSVDFRVDNKIILFSWDQSFQHNTEAYKEKVTIVNACRQLSGQNLNAYVYCIRTNELVQIA